MMKNYTPVLVNTSKPKFSLKTFLLGSAAAKNYYYCARHKTEDIYILWIETTRFGNSFCFPCVLDEQGDAMVYLTGRGLQIKTKNAAMIQRWNLFAKPTTFHEEYQYRELTPQDFHDEYSSYKNNAMGFVPSEADAAALAGDEEPAALPEADGAPETEAESAEDDQ